MPTLADKITSEEELNKVPNTGSSRILKTIHGAAMYLPWYLRREWARIDQGIYPGSTLVLDKVNSLYPQLAVHVSKEDPAFIAYTPDRAFGEGDRQLKTSLGKFLTKYYPHVPDDEIRDAVAEHLGELSCEVEFLEGQAITDYYLNAAEGTGSCMTKDFGSVGGHHPSEIYQAEGIKLAVVRNSEGKITGRGLVYHAAETDKRIIRTYGDQKLRTRLGRLGYVVGRWHGVKFNTVVLDEEKKLGGTYKKVLMPYLDGNGGSGGESSSCVAIIDGVLTSVTSDSYYKLRELFGSAAAECATNTCGHMRLKDLDSKMFSEQCAVTGKWFSKLEEPLVNMYKDGKIVKVCQAVLIDARLVRTIHPLTKRVERVWMLPSEPMFMHNHDNWKEGPAEREACGYAKMDPRYYPDEQDWVQKTNPYTSLADQMYDGYVLTTTGLIRRTDAVQVIQIKEDKPQKTWVHQEEVSKGYVKVHSMTRGLDLYAAPDIKVHKTPTGRKVVIGVHEVRTTWDGHVEFKRNLLSASCMDNIYYYYVGKKPSETEIVKQAVENAWKKQSKRFSVDSRAFKIYANYINGSVYVTNYKDRLRHATEAGLRWEEIYEKYLKADATALGTESKAVLEYLNYFVTMLKAEMNAYDYNGQHDPSMNTCPPSVEEVEGPLKPTPRGFATPLPTGGPLGTGTGFFISGTTVGTVTGASNPFIVNFA